MTGIRWCGEPSSGPKRRKAMKEIANRMKTAIKSRILNEERGAAAVEYALIAGLISVVIIPTVTTLGQRINTVFQTLANAMPLR